MYDTETGFYYLTTSLKCTCTNKNTSTKIAEKSLLEKMKNPDGTYSLHDSDRFNDHSAWHDQGIVFGGNGPGFDLSEDPYVGLGSYEFNLATAGWEWDNVDLSLFDIGHAEVGAGIGCNGFEVKAIASAWSPSVSFDIFGVEIQVGVEVGAVGGTLEIGPGKWRAEAAYGWGASIGFAW